MKRLYRSREDAKISGVIGGLGEFWNIDANILRLAAILLCLATGVFPLLITYVIAWAIIPDAPGDAHPAREE